MLILCKECGLQISDKAHACPHCGFPYRPLKQKKSHLRLPNGFGQISEMKNPNLRNRWRVMVTIGKTETGRPICKILKPKGYFKTYNDAYQALVEYNKNPYDLNKSMTMSELYESWSAVYFESLKNDSSIRNIKSCWSRCGNIAGMQVRDVRARHLKACIDECEISGLKTRIKTMFNQMFDYALEYEIVDKNVARTFSVENITENVKEHIAFSSFELIELWSMSGMDHVAMILIQCYMGWRPQELCNLKISDVDLENWTIRGGMKTKAGIGRLVPIHVKIKELVKIFYYRNYLRSEYLFGEPIDYNKYRRWFKKVIEDLKLNPEHRAHDPRKTFVTLCKQFNVDEYAIKYLVGHEISDITEKIYTKRDLEWLRSELEKIK